MDAYGTTTFHYESGIGRLMLVSGRVSVMKRRAADPMNLVHGDETYLPIHDSGLPRDVSGVIEDSKTGSHCFVLLPRESKGLD